MGGGSTCYSDNNCDTTPTTPKHRTPKRKQNVGGSNGDDRGCSGNRYCSALLSALVLESQNTDPREAQFKLIFYDVVPIGVLFAANQAWWDWAASLPPAIAFFVIGALASQLPPQFGGVLETVTLGIAAGAQGAAWYSRLRCGGVGVVLIFYWTNLAASSIDCLMPE